MFKVLLASVAFAVATNALEGGRRQRRGGSTFGLVSGDESAREGGEYHCDCGAERTRRSAQGFGLVSGDAAAMEGDKVGTCADPGRVRRSRRGAGSFGLVSGDEAPVEGDSCCCMCCCDAGSRQRRGDAFGLVAGDEAAMEDAACGAPGRRQRRGGGSFGLVSGDESAREGGENDVCACDASSAPQMASAATGSVSDAVLNQLLASNQQLTNALAAGNNGNNGINSVAASTSSASNNPNMNDTELALLVVILVLVIVGVGIVCMSYQQASAANLNQMIQAAIQNEQSTFKADVTREDRASRYSTYSVGDV